MMGRPTSRTLFHIAGVIVLGSLLALTYFYITRQRESKRLHAQLHALLVAIQEAGLGFRTAMPFEPWPWPQSAGLVSFTNSTEYWQFLIKRNILHTNFTVFSAPGIPSYKGTSPDGFTASNNAWCIVADVNGKTPANTPVLFSKNLAISDLSESPDHKLLSSPPFGKKDVVLVTLGGRFLRLDQAQLADFFRDVMVTNKVLRP